MKIERLIRVKGEGGEEGNRAVPLRQASGSPLVQWLRTAGAHPRDGLATSVVGLRSLSPGHVLMLAWTAMILQACIANGDGANFRADGHMRVTQQTNAAGGLFQLQAARFSLTVFSNKWMIASEWGTNRSSAVSFDGQDEYYLVDSTDRDGGIQSAATVFRSPTPADQPELVRFLWFALVPRELTNDTSGLGPPPFLPPNDPSWVVFRSSGQRLTGSPHLPSAATWSVDSGLLEHAISEQLAQTNVVAARRLQKVFRAGTEGGHIAFLKAVSLEG